MSHERQQPDNQEIERGSVDPTGCFIVITGGAISIGVVAIMTGVAVGIATGNFPPPSPDRNENHPEPTPTEAPINSFENSFNSEVQLTPTPELNP